MHYYKFVLFHHFFSSISPDLFYQTNLVEVLMLKDRRYSIPNFFNSFDIRLQINSTLFFFIFLLANLGEPRDVKDKNNNN